MVGEALAEEGVEEKEAFVEEVEELAEEVVSALEELIVENLENEILEVMNIADIHTEDGSHEENGEAHHHKDGETAINKTAEPEVEDGIIPVYHPDHDGITPKNVHYHHANGHDDNDNHPVGET